MTSASAIGPSGPAPPPSHSRPAVGRPSGDSAPVGSKGPASHILEDLLTVDQRPALCTEVVGVGVADHRHAGVSVESFAHLSLAHGSGLVARYYDRQSSGYAQIRPLSATLASRTARARGRCKL